MNGQDIPRWAKSYASVFYKVYLYFKEFYHFFNEKQKSDTLVTQDKIKICELYKKLFENLCLILKRKLSDKNIHLFLPREILIESKKQNFIDDETPFLEYIFDFNDIIDIPQFENNRIDIFIEKIINYYFPAIENFKLNADFEFKNIYANYKEDFDKYYFDYVIFTQPEFQNNDGDVTNAS